MASTTTRLMTFEEYQNIPNPPGGRYELHHGELVNVPFPEQPHVRAQWQLRRLLEKAAGTDGFVDKEIPYRPLPEHECWGADVAYMPRARWDSIDRWLFGVPDLVIEVLSPSNSMSELRDKRKLCLENGCREFWIVDPKLHEVEVSTPDGHTITYKSGQQIPLFFADGSNIAVDAIFE
jgi:Uma2 family endonuclease